MWSLFLAIAGTLLFFVLRARTPNEMEARWPADKRPGFGPQITLRQAAIRFYGYWTPRILSVALVVAWGAKIWVGGWSWWDLLLATVIAASWPFQEWFIHAWLEHLPKVKFWGREFEFMVTKTHRTHHMNPWDPQYGITPPFILVGFLLGLPLVSYLSSPLPIAMTATAVTLTLIVCYEWMHFLMHTSYPPKSKWYRNLWKHHRLHHFKNEENWFGLMATLGDTVLGTNPSVDSAPHSPTCRTLGADMSLEEWTEPVVSATNFQSSDGNSDGGESVTQVAE